MNASPSRRRLIQATGVICTSTTAGCFSQLEASEGQTWPEATRNTLTQSEIEVITEAGLPPDEINTDTDAIKACSIVGWFRTLNSVEDSDLEPAESFLQTASETEQTLSEVESSLADINQLISELKETEYGEISAWDIATSVSSSMRTFDAAVDTSLREVRYWLQLFSAVNDTLSASLEIIRTQLESGPPEEISELDTNIEDSIENLTELETESNNIRQNLSSFAETTGTVAANSNEFRDYSSQVESVFGAASEIFAEAASDLQQFIEILRDARSVLSELENGAQKIQTEHLNAIRGRFSAG